MFKKGYLRLIQRPSVGATIEGMAAAIRETTQPGYVNCNAQIVIRRTKALGTDHQQYVYELKCSHCGFSYGANGSDIHERKCPGCQNGAPGLVLAD